MSSLWAFTYPPLPMEWDDSANVVLRDNWNVVLFPDEKHAMDFIDNLELYVYRWGHPPPTKHLGRDATLAEISQFYYKYSQFLRRWGRLELIAGAWDGVKEVDNPFWESYEKVVGMKRWLPREYNN